MIQRALAVLLTAIPGCMADGSNDVILVPDPEIGIVVGQDEYLAIAEDAAAQWRVCGYIFKVLRESGRASDWILMPDYGHKILQQANAAETHVEARKVYFDPAWAANAGTIAHELGHVAGLAHTNAGIMSSPGAQVLAKMRVTAEDCRM